MHLENRSVPTDYVRQDSVNLVIERLLKERGWA